MFKIIWHIIKKYPWRVFTVILFVIVLLQQCDTPEKRPILRFTTLPKQEIKIKTDFTPKIVYYFDGKELILVHDTVYDTIVDVQTVEIDSAAIVKDWLLTRIYDDTLVSNEYGFVFAKYFITQNKLLKREKIVNLHPIKVSQEPKVHLYAGVGLGGYSDKFGFSGNIVLLTKKQRLFSVSYDPIIQYVSISTSWQIK